MVFSSTQLDTDKVMARKILEQSAKRVQLAPTLNIGTWEWDPRLETQTLSAAVHRIFATDSNQLNYVQTWASRVHPDDWQKVQQAMEDSRQSGSVELEYRYYHPELGLRWLYCKGETLPGHQRMLGVVQDITDRKHIEESLRESEERYRAIVETTPECVKVVAADGTLLHMNSAGLNILGAKSLDVVEGTSVYDLVAPEDRERFREFNERVCGGERDSLEFDLMTLQGVRRHLETHAAPLRRADGTTAQLAVTLDITARKRADERFQNALIGSQRLAAIVESSDDAIVSKDLKGVVSSWNPGAERMFGYTTEEMVGQPITTIIPPELHDDEQRILSIIARGERIDHFETVRLKKNGERIEVSLTVSPVKDEIGNIVGAAKIARDVTERKKAERALRTTERLASVGRLAATVAHEINNPLEAVTNLIYLAKQSTGLPEVQKYLTHAEEELDRVSQLTRQTLGFYRETKAASAMKVGSTIMPLISVFGSRMRRRGIEIHPEIKQDREIYAVPGEIRQLVANLVSNSVDAVADGGRIRIRVSGATEWNGHGRQGVRLTIADSGPGIPVGLRSQLFEPFFTTKKEVGTGLGLWVCKGIVEKHHGSIRVKSSTIPGNSWTAFSVFLPLGAEAEAEDNLSAAT
jgi:PAS domain S-box-containing protein